MVTNLTVQFTPVSFGMLSVSVAMSRHRPHGETHFALHPHIHFVAANQVHWFIGFIVTFCIIRSQLLKQETKTRRFDAVKLPDMSPSADVSSRLSFQVRDLGFLKAHRFFTLTKFRRHFSTATFENCMGLRQRMALMISSSRTSSSTRHRT